MRVRRGPDGGYRFLSEATRSNPALFVPRHVRARCEIIRDLGRANALYARAWDEIKAAR